MALNVKSALIDVDEISKLIMQISEVCTIPNDGFVSEYRLSGFDEYDGSINQMMQCLAVVPEVQLFRQLNYLIPAFTTEVDNDFRALCPSHPAVIAEQQELEGKVADGIPLLDILHLATHTDALLQSHPNQQYLSVIENAPGMNLLIKASWWYRQLMTTAQVQCFINYLYRGNAQRLQQLQADGHWSYGYYDRCYHQFTGE